MPELPDVEMARRDLQRWLGGATITAAHSTDRYILRGTSLRSFARDLAGQRVRTIRRRGKWLRIELAQGILFSHLGMTGSWTRVDDDAPAARSERARLTVDRRGRTSSVCYLDSRRFGRLVLAAADIPEWSELGPDPLADGIDLPTLADSLGRRRRPIKDALMDQSVLAGIGNILATEALWLARIDPRAPSDSLSRRHLGAITRGLTDAIERDLGERARGKTDVFSVYGRKGEPCPRCKTPFARIVLSGRGTTFCPRCQAPRGK